MTAVHTLFKQKGKQILQHDFTTLVKHQGQFRATELHHKMYMNHGVSHNSSICSAIRSDRKSVDSIFGVPQSQPASTVHYQTFTNPTLQLSRGVASGGPGGGGE